jgi:protein TonB
MKPKLRRWRELAALVFGCVVIAGLCWWLLSLGKVEDRVRTEEVEMFDIAQPPPPPPPPPTPLETPVEEKPKDTPQTVQPDPLSAEQPSSTNPPAGDLASLLQDPTAASSPFSGGQRGQGGTGKGPLIGGVAKGDQASRAYADLIKNAIMRHLRRDKALAQQGFAFSIRVRVNASAGLEVVSVSNVTPPELEADINRALRGFSTVDRPPPAGGPVPFVATIRLNQS